MTDKVDHAFEVTAGTTKLAVGLISKTVGVCENVAVTMLADYLVLSLLDKAPLETRDYLTALCQEWIEKDLPGEDVNKLLDKLVEKLHE